MRTATRLTSIEAAISDDLGHTRFDQGLEEFKQLRESGISAYLIDMRSINRYEEDPVWELDPEIQKEDVLHLSLADLDRCGNLSGLQYILKKARRNAVITILTPLFLFCTNGEKSEQAEKILQLRGHLNAQSIGGMNPWSDHSFALRKTMQHYNLDENDLAFMLSRIPPERTVTEKQIHYYLTGTKSIPKHMMKKLEEMNSHNVYQWPADVRKLVSDRLEAKYNRPVRITAKEEAEALSRVLSKIIIVNEDGEQGSIPSIFGRFIPERIVIRPGTNEIIFTIDNGSEAELNSHRLWLHLNSNRQPETGSAEKHTPPGRPPEKPSRLTEDEKDRLRQLGKAFGKDLFPEFTEAVLHPDTLRPYQIRYQSKAMETPDFFYCERRNDLSINTDPEKPIEAHPEAQMIRYSFQDVLHRLSLMEKYTRNDPDLTFFIYDTGKKGPEAAPIAKCRNGQWHFAKQFRRALEYHSARANILYDLEAS